LRSIKPETTAQGIIQELVPRLKQVGATADSIAVVTPYSLTRLPRSFADGIEDEELERLSFYGAMLPVFLSRQKALALIDFYSLFARVMLQPASYGLEASKSQYLEFTTAKEDPVNALFAADGLKASQRGHQLMAQEAVSVLQGLNQEKAVCHAPKPVRKETLELPPALFRRPSSPGSRTS
jgi:phospholipase/lecithinase/hemolysin